MNDINARYHPAAFPGIPTEAGNQRRHERDASRGWGMLGHVGAELTAGIVSGVVAVFLFRACWCFSPCQI